MQQWGFINNFNQFDVFRAIISPILGALDCVYSLWCNAPTIPPTGNIVGVCVCVCVQYLR